MVTKRGGDIYGDVNSARDIREINRKIRAEMDLVERQEQLTELKRRSDYLCTLVYSPGWRKKFGARTDELLRVAMEENRRTVEKANKIARKKGWDVEYHAWREGKLPYKPSQARYDGGGMVKYLVYVSQQPLRTGRVQQRLRVKRLYFPADATDIRLDPAGPVEKRTGRKAFGVRVRYRLRLDPRGGNRTLRERWVERTKVVELPEGATDVNLVDTAPEGPRMAVA